MFFVTKFYKWGRLKLEEDKRKDKTLLTTVFVTAVFGTNMLRIVGKDKHVLCFQPTAQKSIRVQHMCLYGAH